MYGLVQASDMCYPLFRHAMADCVHLDVHTYNRDMPLPGWGKGVNIVIGKGDDRQRVFACKAACLLDAHMQDAHVQDAHVQDAQRRASERSTLPPPTVIYTMQTAPEEWTDWHHDDSNAVSDYARYRGALSLLVELPVHRNGEPVDAGNGGWSPSYMGVEGWADALAAVARSALPSTEGPDQMPRRKRTDTRPEEGRG